MLLHTVYMCKTKIYLQTFVDDLMQLVVDNIEGSLP